MKIKKIKLRNFSIHDDLEANLSGRVFHLSGEGKVHLMKLLYTAMAITIGSDRDKGFADKLTDVFMPYNKDMTRLISRGAEDQMAELLFVREDGAELKAVIQKKIGRRTRVDVTGETEWKKVPMDAFYVPPVDLLATAAGLISTTSKREMYFSDCDVDLVKKAFLPKLREVPDSFKGLVEKLEMVLGGTVHIEGEHFFLRKGKIDQDFSSLSHKEGKLAMFLLMVKNGSIGPGTTLFMDTPDAFFQGASDSKGLANVVGAMVNGGINLFFTCHQSSIFEEELVKTYKGVIR